jgi:hypothetical protein
LRVGKIRKHRIGTDGRNDGSGGFSRRLPSRPRRFGPMPFHALI